MELPSFLLQNTKCVAKAAQLHIHMSKNVLFKNDQLYWIYLFQKRTETRLYPCRPQPVRHPLTFEILHTYIVDLWLHRYSVIFKQHNIGVYILSGKGATTGCVYMGTVLFDSEQCVF